MCTYYMNIASMVSTKLYIRVQTYIYMCTGRMIYITAATESPSAGNTNEEVGNNPFALHAGDMSFDELAKPASGLRFGHSPKLTALEWNDTWI